jgi:hypothetical protein
MECSAGVMNLMMADMALSQVAMNGFGCLAG